MLPCSEDNRSFFEKLQKAEGLDLRDNRGKRHDLAVVLVGVTLAVLSNRDGCLSSIHRHLQNHYEKLVWALGVENDRPVSRSQLPVILEKVAVEVFDDLLCAHSGLRLNQRERACLRWTAKSCAAALSQARNAAWPWCRLSLRLIVRRWHKIIIRE